MVIEIVIRINGVEAASAKVQEVETQTRRFSPDLEADGLLAALDPETDTSEKVRETPIEDLMPFPSVRTFNCLKKGGINTLGQLADCTRERLMTIRNWGQSSQKEVDEILEQYGFPPVK